MVRGKPKLYRDAPVVVITGASSGIGEATAEAFARDGTSLVLAARDGEALEAVAERCRRIGARALAVRTDVTDAAAVKRLARQALGFGGHVDVWVSNVGTGAVGAFHETPIEAHEQVIRTNLISHMNDAHAVLPIFISQRKGVFINMISLGGGLRLRPSRPPTAPANSASEGLQKPCAGNSSTTRISTSATSIPVSSIRRESPMPPTMWASG